jgi:phosphopantothenoylcysteine synthetase/decarboxylase
LQRALVCIKAENCIISYNVFKVQIIGQGMIYNRSIEGSGSLPQYKAEVTTMLKDMDFGVYGKGIDGYIHYSLAMDRIQEEEESRKALMDEFDNDVDEMDELDNDEDNFDSDDLDSDDFGSDDFGSDDF